MKERCFIASLLITSYSKTRFFYMLRFFSNRTFCSFRSNRSLKQTKLTSLSFHLLIFRTKTPSPKQEEEHSHQFFLLVFFVSYFFIPFVTKIKKTYIHTSSRPLIKSGDTNLTQLGSCSLLHLEHNIKFFFLYIHRLS